MGTSKNDLFLQLVVPNKKFGLSHVPKFVKAKSHFLVPHPVQSSEGGYRIPHM